MFHWGLNSSLLSAKNAKSTLVNHCWLWLVKNIDLVCEKQRAWNERGTDLYSARCEVKYANKYVLDLVSPVCRSSGRCYLITVLSRQLWRDERSFVIIFKELKNLLFLKLPDIFKWVKFVTLPCVWLLASLQHFASLAKPELLWVKVNRFYQHRGPGTRPLRYGWLLGCTASLQLCPSVYSQTQNPNLVHTHHQDKFVIKQVWHPTQWSPSRV